MMTTNKQLCLLLVLMLVGSNMALSAHVSSHSSSDTGLCSLCIHPGSPDTVIAHDSGTFFISSVELDLSLYHVQIRVLPAILHVHQSRAPPSLA